MDNKVQRLLVRLSEVEQLLGKPETLSDKKKYRSLAQEHAQLNQLKDVWEQISASEKHLAEAQELLAVEQDAEFIAVLQEEISQLTIELDSLRGQLKNLLVPPDPNDSKNTIIEIRAGTGGEEAALFVADCVRMYKMFADQQNWRYEELNCAHSDMGGYKEYVMVLTGPNVYRLMRNEGGTHRVQRVPDTEAQGRIHTSAVTIAVLMEPDEDSDIVIDEKDLRIDTYRSSGAGGQHVNVTDSAVRLTHLPTGIVVACQEERSQHKNREKAMRVLKAKIAEAEQQKKMAEIASDRAKQVGTGDRSERIRTYNFPQNRITDHRINLTLYNLDRVMEGQLGEIVNALVAHFYQQQMEA